MSLRDQISSKFRVVQWSGSEALISCPHPDHDDKNPSASINIDKRVWYCHSCGRGGSLAALIGGWVADPRVDDVLAGLVSDLNDNGVDTFPESWLDQFDSSEVHPYWLERGLSERVCREFRLGYDHTTDKVTYPLRTPVGDVLGVVQRTLDPDEWPKYKYPAGVKVSETLFAYHLIRQGVKDIVVVEGALDALAMWDVGIPAVAQFGARLSHRQADLLRALGLRTLTLAYDQDQAGREALERALTNSKLNFCPLRIMSWNSSDGKDPLDLGPIKRIAAYQAAELVWGG